MHEGGKAMPKMNVYFAKDGSVHIRWNISDGIPDHDTLVKLAEAIKAHKKAPPHAATWNEASVNQTQEHSTTETVSRQELADAMEIISQLPEEDVEEITQRARDMIQGRA